MNESQKTASFVVMAVVAAMLIFPPFHTTSSNGVVKNLGYSWITDPPVAINGTYGDTYGTVDIGMLLAQWAGVLVVGGISFAMLKDKS